MFEHTRSLQLNPTIIYFLGQEGNVTKIGKNKLQYSIKSLNFQTGRNPRYAHC